MRSTFKDTVKSLIVDKLMETVNSSLDAAFDQMTKEFLRSSLPPRLSAYEAARTVQNGGEKWSRKLKKVVNRVEIDPDDRVRLIRAKCVRLVSEDDGVKVYFNTENTRVYREMEENFIEIEPEAAPTIEALIMAYPCFMKPEDLPYGNDDDDDDLMKKMKVVQDLWERNVLMSKEPLEAHYDD